MAIKGKSIKRGCSLQYLSNCHFCICAFTQAFGGAMVWLKISQWGLCFSSHEFLRRAKTSLRSSRGCGADAWWDACSRNVKRPCCPRVLLSGTSIFLLQNISVTRAGLQQEANKSYNNPPCCEPQRALWPCIEIHCWERECGTNVLVSLDGSNYLILIVHSTPCLFPGRKWKKQCVLFTVGKAKGKSIWMWLQLTFHKCPFPVTFNQ